MKSFSKFIMACLGAVAVPVFLLLAIFRRVFCGAAISSADDIVFVYSQVIWDEVWQRPQEFAWLTARRAPTVYCAPVQMHNLLYLKSKWKSMRHDTTGSRHLLILSPLIFSGHFKNEFVHNLNAWIVAWHVRLALPRRANLRILANTPFAARVLQHIKKNSVFCAAPADTPRELSQSAQWSVRSLVFDIIDDFTAFEWAPGFGKTDDAWLTAHATSIIAGTHELAAARPGTRFIACGVDFELFSAPRPIPPDIVNLPRPIIGYFGTISERIALQLIDALSRAQPGASLVLVGPVHFNSEDLPRRANIHYLGLRRHEELPAFAQAFDVALIPFRITPATIKLNPVKTLEYLAAGVPVVATAIPDLVRYYSDLISIASDSEDFVSRVAKELESTDEEKRRAGIERARRSSWQSMADEIYDCLYAPAGAPGTQSLPAPGNSPVDANAAPAQTEAAQS